MKPTADIDCWFQTLPTGCSRWGCWRAEIHSVNLTVSSSNALHTEWDQIYHGHTKMNKVWTRNLSHTKIWSKKNRTTNLSMLFSNGRQPMSLFK